MKALLLLLASCLFAFEGYQGRPLELLSLFLPPNPGIYAPHSFSSEQTEIKALWPASHTGGHLLRIHLEEAGAVPPALWDTAQAVYLDAHLFPEEGTLSYLHLVQFLAQKGLTLLTRWNHEAAHTSALFVKKSFFTSPATDDYLLHHAVNSDLYSLYDLVVFYRSYGQVRYYLDNDESDSVKRTLKTGHAYEGNLSLMLHALAKPHSLVLDIGAHIGVHTIFLSRKVGPFGAVISFEPNKKLYMEHLANLELNGCKNVLPICKGLGETRKTVSQRKIEIEQNDPLEGDPETIEIVPLDAYHLNGISLIKMDVENYEYFALLGMRETLLRNKPVLLFETWINYEPEKRNQAEQRHNFERVMALLGSYGYEIYVIYNCDFLAIPIGADDPLLEHYRRTLQRLDPAAYQGAE